MELVGYLELSDATGDRVVVDNWSTMNLARAHGSRWSVLNDCDDCACPSATCALGSVEEASWFREDNPASGEFLGVFGQLVLAQPAPDSFSTGRAVAPAKTLTFSGVVLSTSARGAQYGYGVLAEWLDPDCGGCGPTSATVRLWCPDQLCDPTDPTVEVPVEEVAVDWCDVAGIDGFEAAPVLGLTPDADPVVDDGARVLPDVRYVPGSLQEVVDQAPPSCDGMRVTFQFTVASSERFIPDAGGGCLMRSPGECDPQPCCTGLAWDLSPSSGACGCPTSCACTPAGSVLPTGAVDVWPDGLTLCRYSTPLCAQMWACLAGPFSSNLAVPVVDITAGTEDLFDVSVTIWEAMAGLPDPTTAEGFEVYSNIAPVVDPALIARIPAQATYTLDGRAQRETLACPGFDAVDSPAARCGDLRYRHPTLCCGSRYWIAVELPCGSGSWEVRTSLFGVERA